MEDLASLDGNKRYRLQILTTPTSDTPGTTLLISAGDRNYLFGQMHAGLQRALLDHDPAALRVSEIFTTGPINYLATEGIDNLLSSQSLHRHLKGEHATTVPDLRTYTPGYRPPQVETSSRANLTLHAGPGIFHRLAIMRRQASALIHRVRVEEFKDDIDSAGTGGDLRPDWSDDRLKIWKFFLHPSHITPLPNTPILKLPYREYVRRDPWAVKHITSEQERYGGIDRMIDSPNKVLEMCQWIMEREYLAGATDTRMDRIEAGINR